MRIVLSILARLAAAPAGAQGTRGLLVNGHTMSPVLYGEDGNAGEEFSDDGPGLGVRVGYGFSERIAGYLGLAGVSIYPEEGAAARP